MATEGATLVRVGNPLSAPLSLRRLLIQIDPGELANDNEGHEETRLAELLESRAASGPVVLVVDRAETLAADALLALQHVASGSGAIKVVFFGSPTAIGLFSTISTHRGSISSIATGNEESIASA